MKYIKLYENRNEKLYWLIPTDDRFEDSLKKIKCAKSYSEGLLKSVHQYTRKSDDPNFDNKYMFIGYNGKSRVKHSSSKWGWNPYYGKLYDSYYEEEGYKFAGMVNIEEYELTANKYNL
jgi:hypothetical protein